MSETENLASFLLKHAIERANKGYAEYAAEAAFYAAVLLRDNSPLPKEGREYLAEALDKIASGESPNAALKLNGRKKLETLEREQLIAEAVYRAKKSGKGVDYLFQWFADNGISVGSSVIRLSKEAIRAAYYAHKERLEGGKA